MNAKKLLKITFSLLLVSFILQLVDLDEVWQVLRRVNPWWYALGALMVVCDQSYMGAKWNILLRMVGVRVPVSVSVLAYLKGCAYRYLAPATLGIDAYKTYYVRKYHPQTDAIISSIIVERLFGVLTSLFVVALMFYFFAREFGLGYESWIAAGCIIAALTFLLLFYNFANNVNRLSKLSLWTKLPTAINNRLQPALQGLDNFQNQPKTLYLYILLSIVEKFFYGIILYTCVRALNIDSVSFLFVISATPVLSLIDRLPVSFSSIGVREGMLVLILKPFGVDASTALSVALLIRGIELMQILLFTLLWQFDHQPKPSLEELGKLKP